MKKIIGYSAICFAAGMLFMLFLTNEFVGFLIIVILVLLGINLLLCDPH